MDGQVVPPVGLSVLVSTPVLVGINQLHFGALQQFRPASPRWVHPKVVWTARLPAAGLNVPASTLVLVGINQLHFGALQQFRPASPGWVHTKVVWTARRRSPLA